MKSFKEIQPIDIWDDKKKSDLKKFISLQSNLQTDERKLINELLAIQYKIEDYIENENSETLKIIDFVKMYLKIFNFSQKNLANLFEMQSSNLHKYLVGERKLNTDLVLKLSSFSNTLPEYWFRIQVKNDLKELNKTKNFSNKYKKYSYQNLVN